LKKSSRNAECKQYRLSELWAAFNRDHISSKILPSVLLGKLPKDFLELSYESLQILMVIPMSRIKFLNVNKYPNLHRRVRSGFVKMIPTIRPYLAMAYSMVKACKLESCPIKARGSAKFPNLSTARANEKTNRGLNFAIWRSVFTTL
jgi:hypothetical protein